MGGGGAGLRGGGVVQKLKFCPPVNSCIVFCYCSMLSLSCKKKAFLTYFYFNLDITFSSFYLRSPSYRTPNRSGMEIFFAFITKPTCQHPLASSSKAGHVFSQFLSKVSQLQDSKQVGHGDLFCIYHQTNMPTTISLKLQSRSSFFQVIFQGVPATGL